MKAIPAIMVLLAACATSGCENLTIREASEVDASQEQVKTVKDLTTQQAEKDAQEAVNKQDFRLLAFANKVVAIPGVGATEQALKLLKEQCGFRFLSGTGDTVEIGDDLSRRKALKRYAEVYNPIVLKGCKTFQKQY